MLRLGFDLGIVLAGSGRHPHTSVEGPDHREFFTFDSRGADEGWRGAGGVAQDPIVLDLTMQFVLCPWLCQAPWRLVSTFLS